MRPSYLICLSLTPTRQVFSLSLSFLSVQMSARRYTKTIILSLRPCIWMFVSLNYNTPITGIIYIDVRTCLCWYSLSPVHLQIGRRPQKHNGRNTGPRVNRHHKSNSQISVKADKKITKTLQTTQGKKKLKLEKKMGRKIRLSVSCNLCYFVFMWAEACSQTFAGLLNVISCFEGQKLKKDQSKETEALLKRS